MSVADDPYWCSVKIDGQKRYTREVMGDDPWTDHVSLLVYNLHADKVKYISTCFIRGVHGRTQNFYFHDFSFNLSKTIYLLARVSKFNYPSSTCYGQL